jgi:anti-sigma-K factor RskA
MIDKRTEAQISRYVLGTLPPGEVRVLETAMRADPKLRLLVKELRGTDGTASGARTPVDPPSRPEQRAPVSTAKLSPAPAAASAPRQSDEGESWSEWVPWALAACFAILCVALLFIGRSLREQAVALNRQLEERNLQAGELQEELDQLRSRAERQGTNYQARLADAQREFLQRIGEINRQFAARTNQLYQEKADAEHQMMLHRNQADRLRAEKKALEDALLATAASDRLASARIAVLRPTADGPPGALGASVWSPQDQRGLLVLEGIPPPPPTQVYQLWLHDPALRMPVSGGVLQVGRGGSVRLQFAAPARVETAERFSITAEPVGGVAAPAGRIIMTGN